MTMMKYPGSSIDLGLDFLFRSFDRRICIDLDWLEHPISRVRSLLEACTAGCPTRQGGQAADP